MAKSKKLPFPTTPRKPDFAAVRRGASSGQDCKVLAAMMEDSFGGISDARLDTAMNTCDCDICS